MASKDAFVRLQKKGYPVDECPYNRYDMLESAEDLAALGDTLCRFRDHRGCAAKLTANMIVGNPDFARIRRDHFSKYSVKPFWETFADYGHENAFPVYRELVSEGLLKPQLHGREHTAVSHWLEALRLGEKRFRDAFDEGMYTVHPGGETSGHRDMLDALGYVPTDRYYPQLPLMLREAQRWFEEFWGWRSETFIAPCYTWHPQLEKHLADIGISYIQGTRVQRVPREGRGGSMGRIRHYTGQVNKNGQAYLVRNVSLEPSLSCSDTVCIKQALSEVACAFGFRAPVIVSSHRLNYIGGLEANNRDRGLRVLAQFLTGVLQKWPDVEFLSSDELGARIGC